MSKDGGMLQHIPNIITLLNLGCGALAIHYIYNNDWWMVCLLIGFAGIADFADGLVARGLGVTSPIGKELDSLADMVSFGLVPGMIVFQLLLQNSISIQYALPALLIPLGAALRLARFNIEDDSSGDFIGLSTPAATALVIGLLLLILFPSPYLNFDPASKGLLYGVSFLLPILMTSKIKMFSLKFKALQWHGNQLRWIFIIGFIIMAIFLRSDSIFMVIAAYILVSIILHLFQKST